MKRTLEGGEGGQWIPMLLGLLLLPLQAPAQTCEPRTDPVGGTCEGAGSFSLCPDGIEIRCACQGTLFARARNEKGEQACNAGDLCVIDAEAATGCYACATSGQRCQKGEVTGLEVCAALPGGQEAGNVCSSGLGDCKRTGARMCSADGQLACSAEPGDPSRDRCGNLVDDDCNGRADQHCGENPERNCREATEDSVDFTSGNLDHEVKLASLLPPAGSPLELSLTWNSRRAANGALKGWLFNFEAAARVTETQIRVQLGSGYVMNFPRPTQPAADESSYSPPASGEVPVPRPLPQREFVERPLEGNNYGVYLAQACPGGTSCLIPLAVRLVMPDGRRLIFKPALEGSIAELSELEDVFGNRQVVSRTFNPATGLPLTTTLLAGEHALKISWQYLPNGKLHAAQVSRGHGTSFTDLLTLAVTDEGQLEEVCAIDAESRLRPQQCAPRSAGSACSLARTVEAFGWQHLPNTADGPVKVLSRVYDETCNVIQQVGPDGGWEVTDAGIALPRRLETAREALAFRWTSDPLGRIARVVTESFLGAEDAGVRTARTLHEDIARLKETSEDCGCGAATSLDFDSESALRTSDLRAEVIGKEVKLQRDYLREPGGPDDPFRYGQPIAVTETDVTGRSAPRQTLYQYHHPFLRTPTTIRRQQSAVRFSKVVLDYDDDDTNSPCIDGVIPVPNTTPAPNTRPTPFLCRVLEYADANLAQPSRVTRFKYARDGRLLEQVNPAGLVTKWEYAPERGLSSPLRLFEVRRGGQLVVRLGAYSETGIPRLVEYPNFDFRGYDLDARGRVVRVDSPDGSTFLAWAADGKPDAITLVRSQQLKFTWGNFGRLDSVRFSGSAAPESLIGWRQLTYDRAGNVTLEETKDAAGVLVKSVERRFDAQRQLVWQRNAQGGEKKHEYRDNLISKTIDELGYVTQYFHDGFGRLRELRAPLGAVTQYEWDGHDNLVSVTDANGNPLTYGFDGLGNLRTVTSRDTGTTIYEYTADGLVSERFDAESENRNESIQTVYDSLRRPSEVRVVRGLSTGGMPQSQLLTRFLWDDASRKAVGKLWRVEDYLPDGGVQRRTLSYDFAGRLDKEVHERPGAALPFEFNFGYAAGGTLDQLAYPPQLPSASAAPTVLDLTVGLDEEVEHVAFGNVALATSVQHYPFGLGLKSVTRGMQNLIHTEYELNLDGQRTAVRSNAPVSFEYELDARGLVRLARHTGDVPRVNVYEHDELQRLRSAEYRDPVHGLAPVLGETYTFDKAGNRLRKDYPATGKAFISVFDWKQPQSVPPVPDNNLLRAVLDPTDGGVCDVDGGRPSGCKKSPNADLAGVEAGWKELLSDARDLLTTAPFLTEAQLRGRVIAWVDALRAWQTEFNLSGQTLLLLLLSSEAGPHEFMDAFNAWLDRRAAGLALDGTDFELLKRMLNLAEKLPVRRAAVMDPNWVYSYDAAGNVTEVMLDTPEFARVVKPIETFFCYRHDARRRLVRVESASRLKTLLAPTPPSPCVTGEGLRLMAEYRFDSRNLRTYSNVMGLETHYLFSPQGQLLAEATPTGALQKQYLYLDGEPFAQVVLNDGSGVRPPSLPPGCSTAGGREDEVLFALAALCALTLAGRRRSRVGLLALLVLLSVGAPACTFDAGYLPGKGREKKPRLKGADLKDPVYFFHNDRLGTPQRLTSETGATVWRGEFRPFGDIFRLEEDVDQNGVAVENNLRFPGMYDEALSGVLFQTGPYQNHHRWYSPDLGRYLSSEPLLKSPRFVQSLVGQSRPLPAYAYSANSPVDFFDPDGLHLREPAPPANLGFIEWFERRCSAGSGMACALGSVIDLLDAPNRSQPGVMDLFDLPGVQACGVGTRIALKPLHTTSLSKVKLEGLRKLSTEDIVKSLQTPGDEFLRIRPDGTVLQGNHRVTVLLERGFDTSSLSEAAEIILRDMSFFP